MMHVSWTTLQEQIFAKLRRPYRSEANMNEVGHGPTNVVLLRAKKVGHQISVSFEKFDVVQALLSFF
jgi:hypothetical protein